MRADTVRISRSETRSSNRVLQCEQAALTAEIHLQIVTGRAVLQGRGPPSALPLAADHVCFVPDLEIDHVKRGLEHAGHQSAPHVHNPWPASIRLARVVALLQK